MIRTFWIMTGILLGVSMLHAAQYTLQFGAFDYTHPAEAKKNAMKLVQKAKAAGIDVHLVIHRVADQKYLLVQTTTVRPKVAQLRALRKKAIAGHLDFYVRRVAGRAQKQMLPPPPHIPDPIALLLKTEETPLSENFFAHNPRFREIIEEGLHIRRQMRQNKKNFLDSYIRYVSKTPLEAKLKYERAVDAGREGADVGLLWNIFDGGFFGKRSLTYKKLARSLVYDKEIDKITDSYSKMAQIEIAEVKKNVDYYYTRQQTILMKEMLKHYQKGLTAGIITQSRYNTLKSLYDQKRKSLDYLKYQNYEKFDNRYQKLISKIEYVKLLDIDSLQQVALQNIISKQQEEDRYTKLTTSQDWRDRVKAKAFVDRKQYTFIPRRETLAGIELDIPLTMQNDHTYAKAQKLLLKQKHESEKLLLEKEIEAVYMDIAYRQNEIEKQKKSLSLAKKNLKTIALKRGAPIASQKGDLYYEAVQERLNMLQSNQRIWELRADILLDLIQLQYTSGIKIL